MTGPVNGKEPISFDFGGAKVTITNGGENLKKKETTTIGKTTIYSIDFKNGQSIVYSDQTGNNASIFISDCSSNIEKQLYPNENVGSIIAENLNGGIIQGNENLKDMIQLKDCNNVEVRVNDDNEKISDGVTMQRTSNHEYKGHNSASLSKGDFYDISDTSTPFAVKYKQHERGIVHEPYDTKYN